MGEPDIGAKEGTMLARYVAEIEEVLMNKGVAPPANVEPPQVSRRDWILCIAAAAGMLVLAGLWATGILLGLFARLFM